ncbi:TonB-dependent receptor [Woodsholea maritima]|uniref:TonB-dependent receptor n=1 Tax=Woodsholea maritima TaxID=240237 RepID=UPI000373D030|nr:TonB-dependent receptor [Woodsholea maritima]
MKVRPGQSILTAALCSASIFAFAPGVNAQDAEQAPTGRSMVPDVIVVTARKREETVRDVPFSLNVQTQAAIRATGSTDIESLANSIAGLTIQNLGPGQSQIALRGISAGQIVRDQPQVKEQVGVYLDESAISLSLFTPDIDLFDLNRVETLRGPQGTLFGSGSLAGTIRYITNQPNLDDYEAEAEAEINTIDDGGTGGHLKGMVNFPIVEDKLGLRIVGYRTNFGGYIDAYDANYNLKKDVNDGTRQGIRASLTYEPTIDISITPRILYQEIDYDGFNREEHFHILANELTTTRPTLQLGAYQQFLLLDEKFKDEFFLSDVSIEWDTPFATINAISSYTARDVLVSRDASALTGSVSYDIGMADAGVMLPSNLQDTTKVNLFTQEVRLTSNGDGPFQWVAGVYYMNLNRKYKQYLPTPGWDDGARAAGFTDAALYGNYAVSPIDSPYFSLVPYTLKQTALFGEATYDFNDRLSLTAGLRYYDFEEERTLTFDGFFATETLLEPGETSSDGFSPRILLSYDVSDDWTLNAQASKGFRLGGINDPLNAALCSAEDLQTFGGRESFDDEEKWNYEVGAKGVMMGGRANFSGALFYAKIEGLQATIDAGSCSSRIVFNVPEAHTMGGEFDFSALATENLEFTVSASYADAQLDSTVTTTSGGTTTIIAGIEDGARLPTAPQFEAALNATYTWYLDNMDVFLTGTLQHVGDRYTQFVDETPNYGTFTLRGFGGVAPGSTFTLDPKLPSYELVNLRLGVIKDNWEVVAYANNVFSEKALLSYDRERGGVARLSYRVNTPRTIGVNFRMSY